MPQVRQQPGDLINNRYKVLGPLGEGGFAVVYKAEDLAIGRDVAIKILNMTASGHTPEQRETNIKRFRQEARTAAKIKHPNAVTIFDVGVTEDDNHPYMVMDLLQGHDLKDELEHQGPLSQERAIHLFSRCLEALAEAHRLGIVHKDLKPSNLFLTDPNTDYESLIILDFGIAGFAQAGQKRLTQAGQILGTPQYMAPEYIANQTLSPPLDVYQMGLILVEMLTGNAVVSGENMMHSIMVHAEGLLNIPDSILQSPIGPIVQKATQREADLRYPDADAFRKDLNALQQRSSMALSSIQPPQTGAFPPHTGAFPPHTDMLSAQTPPNPFSTQAQDLPHVVPVPSLIPNTSAHTPISPLTSPGFASPTPNIANNWNLPYDAHSSSHQNVSPTSSQPAFTPQPIQAPTQHTHPSTPIPSTENPKPTNADAKGCIATFGLVTVVLFSLAAILVFGFLALLFGLAIFGTQVG